MFILYAGFSSNDAFATVYWVNNDVATAFPTMNTNACNFTTCPIEKDKKNTYSFTLQTDRTYSVVRYFVNCLKIFDHSFVFFFFFSVEILHHSMGSAWQGETGNQRRFMLLPNGSKSNKLNTKKIHNKIKYFSL